MPRPARAIPLPQRGAGPTRPRAGRTTGRGPSRWPAPSSCGSAAPVRPLRMMYAAQQAPARASASPSPTRSSSATRAVRAPEMRTTPAGRRAPREEVAPPAREDRGEHQRPDELDRHGDPDRQPGERGRRRPGSSRPRPAAKRTRPPSPPGGRPRSRGRATASRTAAAITRRRATDPAAPIRGISVAAPPICTETTAVITSSRAGERAVAGEGPVPPIRGGAARTRWPG